MKKPTGTYLFAMGMHFFGVVVGLMTFTGCGERNKSIGTEFLQRIVVEAKPTDFTLSQVIDSISFVALEINQDALIDSITKLLVTDSTIYWNKQTLFPVSGA